MHYATYTRSRICVYTYTYEYICTSMYMFIRCLARDASTYFFENASRFAITYLCVGQPFIFFRDIQYMKQQWYSNGALNRNPDQIRDTRRLPLFWFKTYRRVSSRGVSWSDDWLQIFVFSLSFSSTRYALFPCLAHVLMKPVLKS